MHDEMEFSPDQIRQIGKRMQRWRILRFLHSGRGLRGMSEELLLQVLERMEFEINRQLLQRELKYLADLELITITTGREWISEITAKGVDVVEYSTACPPGILRPEQP